MADDDLVIDIAADDDAAVTTEVKTPATPAPPGTSEGVDELKRQLSEFRTRVDQSVQEATVARQEATTARQEIERVKGESVDNQMTAIDNGIAAAQAEAEAAAQEYRTAMDAADHAKGADAQRKIARAEAKAVRFEEAKTDLEARRAEKTTEAPPRQLSQTEIVSQATANLEPKTREWLRSHPEFVTDPRKNSAANAADYDAVERHNLARGSDDYFKHCEVFLGIRPADPIPQPASVTPQPAQQRKTTVMAAAPVSRESAPSNGAASEQVTLTRGEQATATDGSLVWNYDDPSGKNRWTKGSPIGIREMARRKAAMTKEGRYDKSMVT